MRKQVNRIDYICDLCGCENEGKTPDEIVGFVFNRMSQVQRRFVKREESDKHICTPCIMTISTEEAKRDANSI